MNSKNLLNSYQISGNHPNNNTKSIKRLREELSATVYRSIINRMEDIYKKMPTDYQDLHFFGIVERSFSILKDVVDQGDIVFELRTLPCIPVPLWGTANLKGQYVFIESVEREAVIVFDNNLLTFIEKIIEVYTTERLLIKMGMITPRLQELLTKHFIDIMMCYHGEANAYYAIPLSLCEMNDFDDLDSPDKISEFSSSFDMLFNNEIYLGAYSEISTCAYLWLAAHEYAHLLLGHLSNYIGHDEQQEECDADMLGAQISLESKFSVFISTGIYIAMKALSFCYHESENNTYVSIRTRIQKMAEYLVSVKKTYVIDNFKTVDILFSSKIRAWRKFEDEIKNKRYEFSTLFDMQRFLYKQFSID